jgi:predicted esterase
MPMPILVARKLSAVCAAVVLFCSIESGWAAVVILNDGTILKGRKLYREEKELIVDPVSGQVFSFGKGFFVLDDGARRIVFRGFPPDNIASVDERDIDNTPDLVVLKQEFVPLHENKLQAIGAIGEISAFDNNWRRTFKFTANPGKASETDNAQQKMVVLTPHYAQVAAVRWKWSAFYATRELGPETVRKLLHSHPLIREPNGKVDPERRTKAFRFLKQAGMVDAAELELAEWLRASPGDKEQVDELRAGLASLRAEQLLVDLERGYQAGRHDWVRKKLESFPNAAADNKQLVQLAALKRKYATADATLNEVRRLLATLPAQVVNPDRRRFWTEAAQMIVDEVTSDSVPRLEKFVQFAQQAERQRKQGEKPTENAEELLARAVCSWLLASTAPATPDEGLKLWRTRKFVREYQRTTAASTRKKLLESYEKEGALAFDELAQLISLLPPPEPEAKIEKSTLELETREAVARRKGGMPYVLQLPPEYRHSRSYPLLFVLHHAGEKPADFLEKWSALAAAHGFLLVAPDWSDGGKRSTYGYSSEEHAAVTLVLRDLQQRFNVDTDRVFLAGFGEGGAMAFDVGLSHPDLFAGVVTMAAPPRLFSQKYAANARHLPFYVVAGDMQAGDCHKAIHNEFKAWFGCTASALWIEYKGRGLEWFPAEVAHAFDWMGRRQRLNPLPATGEFATMRASDNRFYWLTVDDLENRCLADVSNCAKVEPARVSARIQNGNRIFVNTIGVKHVTVWLDRSMVDFKKVTLIVNQTGRFKDQDLTPRLGTLLEDFYERGDRSRLFLVKIPLDV